MPSNEPTALQAAALTAVNATLGLLGLVLNWPQETMAALLLVSGAWISFAALMLRAKVVPVVKVQAIMDQRGASQITDAEFKAA